MGWKDRVKSNVKSNLSSKLNGGKPVKSDWAARGAEEARKMAEAAKNARPEYGPREFWLNDGESATVRFLSDEPDLVFYRHTLKVGGKYQSYTCLSGNPDKDEASKSCPLCRVDGAPRGLKMAYWLIDRRKFTDKKGKTHKNQLRLLVLAQRYFPLLDEVAQRRGLKRRDILVKRTGTSQNTMYNFIPEDKSPLSSEDMEAVEKRVDLKDALKPVSEEKMGAVAARFSDKSREAYEQEDGNDDEL